MRRPVNKLDVRSLVICAAILAGIFLVEVVCAYAFVDDFSFRLDATATASSSEKDEGGNDLEENEYSYLDIEFDKNAVNGMIDPSEKTGTKKGEGTVAFKINPNPQFKNGAAEGELMIENHGDNQNLFKVRFELISEVEVEEEEPQIIYQSGFLAPDMHIPSAKLDVELEKGEYPVMAVIEAYSVETLEPIGELTQEITIKILK